MVIKIQMSFGVYDRFLITKIIFNVNYFFFFGSEMSKSCGIIWWMFCGNAWDFAWFYSSIIIIFIHSGLGFIDLVRCGIVVSLTRYIDTLGMVTIPTPYRTVPVPEKPSPISVRFNQLRSILPHESYHQPEILQKHVACQKFVSIFLLLIFSLQRKIPKSNHPFRSIT